MALLFEYLPYQLVGCYLEKTMENWTETIGAVTRRVHELARYTPDTLKGVGLLGAAGAKPRVAAAVVAELTSAKANELYRGLTDGSK